MYATKYQFKSAGNNDVHDSVGEETPKGRQRAEVSCVYENNKVFYEKIIQSSYVFIWLQLVTDSDTGKSSARECPTNMQLDTVTCFVYGTAVVNVERGSSSVVWIIRTDDNEVICVEFLSAAGRKHSATHISTTTALDDKQYEKLIHESLLA